MNARIGERNSRSGSVRPSSRHRLVWLSVAIVVACSGAGVLRLCRAAEPVPAGPAYSVSPMCPPCGQFPGCVPWQYGGPGEYVEHPRTAHVMVYRLRVDDQLRCVFRLTRTESSRPYELNVGDEISVDSFTDVNLNRPSVVVQPDGTVSLRLLGQVKAAHRTIEQLRRIWIGPIRSFTRARPSPSRRFE